MRLSELGEFELIERLAKLVGPASRGELIVGIGDDAAVWRAGSEYLIATTDTMVEGVHFKPELSPWREVGWKALAVNLSDVAAMGATPLFALVTVAAPPAADVEAIEALYEGLAECAGRYGVTIAGGDTVRAAGVSVTVAVIGRAQQADSKPQLLRRDAARKHDVIAVTGTLGASAAGLRQLLAGETEGCLVRRHLHPKPQIEAGRMAAQMNVRCGIDVSDGLLQDVGHICEASGFGAVIQAAEMPVDEDVTEAFPGEGVELACTGGEDYELVLVASEDRMDQVIAGIESVRITVIGQMVADPKRQVRLLDEVGHEITYRRRGWDAFR